MSEHATYRDSGELPTVLTVPEVARSLRMSEVTVWRRIADGGLPSVKIGGLRRVPARALEELLDQSEPKEVA